MLSQSLTRGLLLAGIAIPFGIGALRMPVGELSDPGPGLLPLITSVILLVLAITIIVQSFIHEAPPIFLNPMNISIIILAMLGFAVITNYVNMALAVVWLVFVSTIAGTDYSWMRNVKLSASLIVIGFLFERTFGLNLGML